MWLFFVETKVIKMFKICVYFYSEPQNLIEPHLNFVIDFPPLAMAVMTPQMTMDRFQRHSLPVLLLLTLLSDRSAV